MNVTLYKNVSDFNYINKTLENETTTTGTLRESANLMAPVIRLNRTRIMDVTQFNYCYIPEFNRYYFIQNFSIVNNKLIDLILEEDVLMSFKDEILNQSCIINRQEFKNNQYLKDDNILTYCRPVFDFYDVGANETGVYQFLDNEHLSNLAIIQLASQKQIV